MVKRKSSAGRFNVDEAAATLRSEGNRCNVIHLVWLKPFEIDEQILAPLQKSGRGIVIDSAYEIAGASQSIAYELMLASGCPVKAVGQFDRSPGVAKHLENGTPSVQRIIDVAKSMIEDG